MQTTMGMWPWWWWWRGVVVMKVKILNISTVIVNQHPPPTPIRSPTAGIRPQYVGTLLSKHKKGVVFKRAFREERTKGGRGWV